MSELLLHDLEPGETQVLLCRVCVCAVEMSAMLPCREHVSELVSRRYTDL